MQIFTLFYHGVSQGRGTSITVPAVTESRLWTLMQEKFHAVPWSPEVQGTPKLSQHRNNPDLFDLQYDAAGSSEHYQGGRRYGLPRLATFELQEFEQFPNGREDCERRIDEFIRCMQSGDLQRSFHE